jgi:hypothetical protein
LKVVSATFERKRILKKEGIFLKGRKDFGTRLGIWRFVRFGEKKIFTFSQAGPDLPVNRPQFQLIFRKCPQHASYSIKITKTKMELRTNLGGEICFRSSTTVDI